MNNNNIIMTLVELNDLEKRVIKRNDEEFIDFVNILCYSQICMRKDMVNFTFGGSSRKLDIYAIVKDKTTLKFIKDLTIFYDGFSRMNWLKILPNLEKITLILKINKPEMSNIPIILNKYNHNLKHIIIQCIRPYPSVDLLDTYCCDNNIRFEKDIKI
jgi:hypothetical protein